jgi:predicted metal-dependent phosphoesterase TrpH
MPDLQKLDLHLHTVDDPFDKHVPHTAEELIDRAAALRYTVLAITLHGKQLESEPIRDYAAKRGILLLPGVEQDVEGCHVLLLNFPRETADGIRTFKDLEKARAACAPHTLVAAAHPFYPNSTCLKARLFEHRSLFDAVEVSAFYHRLWDPNRRALEAAEQLGLPVIGNSDTHALEQFGTMWTEVESEQTPESVIAALKSGRGNVQGRPLRAMEMARVAWKVIALGYMPWVNYRHRRTRAA